MSRTEPKLLLKALTRSCTRAIERAVADVVGAREREVGIDRIVLVLLADERSDLGTWLVRHDLEAGPVRAAIERRVDARPGDHSGKPILAPSLLQLIEDTIAGATKASNARRVRSAALVAHLHADPARYDAGALVAALAATLPGLVELVDAPAVPDSFEQREAFDPDAPALPKQRLPRRTISHVVAPGEDLLSISKRYGVDWEELAIENGLEITDAVEPGKMLWVRVLEALRFN